MPSLKVWVVDFDGQVEPYRTTTPLVGPIVTGIAADLTRSPYNQLGYTIRSPADFGYDPIAVRQSIYDEHAYAAIIVNPNATALLEAAVAQGNTSYDPYGAGQIIIISARDQTSYPTYILPSIYNFQFAVSSAFGPAWANRLAQTPSSNLSQVPQAVNPGIAFTLLDLRPFGPPVATPAVTIGLIYLIIISFFSFPFLMPIHMQYAMGDHPPLHFSHMVIWRIMSNVIAYFFLSLCYSLVSLAYQIPFSNPSAPPTQPAANPNAYGKASFFVFWMLNWVGMSALGFPSENVGMILGPPWSALWLIFWVITNVATGFYSLDLAPGFFAWGYAWPLHNSTLALNSFSVLIQQRSCNPQTALTCAQLSQRRAPSYSIPILGSASPLAFSSPGLAFPWPYFHSRPCLCCGRRRGGCLELACSYQGLRCWLLCCLKRPGPVLAIRPL